MAARIVILGHGNKAAEISMKSAYELINEGTYRVTLTRYKGELTDATVLVPARPPTNWSDLASSWAELITLVSPCREFELSHPIPVNE